jgi:predicted phage terminase large subunit-like protein
MAARKKSAGPFADIAAMVPAAAEEPKRTRARDKRPVADPRPELALLGLMDFIPAISPRLESPRHLAELVETFEAVVRGSIRDGRYVVSIPMRHGKTFTTQHMIAWALMCNPCIEIMYISYGASFAQKSSRKARSLALAAGVSLSADHNTIGEWITTDGGGVLATGIEGEIAGRGADIVIIDDPIKSRLIAESPDERQKAADFVQEAISRLNPGGSVFMVSARWHVDDPSGQLLATGEYKHIHKRAIEDEGLPTERALWPEKRPLEVLRKTRHEVKEYNWFSWYQGEPRPPDSSLFKGSPATFQRLPEGCTYAIGIDLGFTVNGDVSAGAVLARDQDGIAYVVHLETCSRTAPGVATMLMALRSRYPSALLFTYFSGPEKGTIDLLTEHPYSLDIIGVPARYNKYARAMGCADAWNGGRVRVPAIASWDVGALVNEAVNFTGGDGERDDRIDAMVAAFDSLDQGGSGLEPGFFGKRCM